jgi:hypothetical protein
VCISHLQSKPRPWLTERYPPLAASRTATQWANDAMRRIVREDTLRVFVSDRGGVLGRGGVLAPLRASLLARGITLCLVDLDAAAHDDNGGAGRQHITGVAAAPSLVPTVASVRGPPGPTGTQAKSSHRLLALSERPCDLRRPTLAERLDAIDACRPFFVSAVAEATEDDTGPVTPAVEEYADAAHPRRAWVPRIHPATYTEAELIHGLLWSGEGGRGGIVARVGYVCPC